MFENKSPKDIAIELRFLMGHVSDTDRCTLCKAAELLEKQTQGSDNWYMWIVIIFMLVGGWGTNFKVSDEFFKSFMETLRNKVDKLSEDTSNTSE